MLIFEPCLRCQNKNPADGDPRMVLAQRRPAPTGLKEKGACSFSDRVTLRSLACQRENESLEKEMETEKLVPMKL